MLFCSPAGALDHSHAQWDVLLKKHVVPVDGGKASRVRYAGMAADKAALERYLGELSAVKQAEFERWTREQQVAFLINAYNAFTVQKVLTRYPDLRSIWDFGKIFGNPFKDRFFVLLEKSSSLDEIEHGILRKKYREPRVHFALNCASVGCPMLREEAYRAAGLEQQLSDQQSRFLSDRSRNRLRGERLEVSRIFDWYGEDFRPLEAYFARFASALADDAAGRELIRKHAAKISFLDYDWTLNDAK
jgi:hypothetical protein